MESLFTVPLPCIAAAEFRAAGGSLRMRGRVGGSEWSWTFRRLSGAVGFSFGHISLGNSGIPPVVSSPWCPRGLLEVSWLSWSSNGGYAVFAVLQERAYKQHIIARCQARTTCKPADVLPAGELPMGLSVNLNKAQQNLCKTYNRSTEPRMQNACFEPAR